MSKEILTLNKEQQQALFGAGTRWWFLPGCNHVTKEKFTEESVDKFTKISTPGRKMIRYKRVQREGTVVFCSSYKVNAKTVYLALPDGTKPKFKLFDVFIPEDRQSVIEERILKSANEDVKKKIDEKISFYVKIN